jgi:flagellar biosynthetic protein FliR
MPSLFNLIETYLFTYLVILIRVTSFFYTAPVFGGTTLPAQAKIGLAAIFSAMIAVVSGPIQIAVPVTIVETMVLVAGEVAFGLTLGYAVSMVFAGIQLAGVLIGYQMGFAVANVLDPVTNDQVSIVGQFLFLFGLLYFLAMNAHHVLLIGIADSFAIAPAGSFSVSQGAVSWMVQVFTHMFWLGMKIAMPVVGVIFLVDVALGIVAKTVPQMNVFIVGLPLKSLLGLFVLALGFPFFALVMRFDFQRMVNDFYGMMHVLAR